MAGLQKHAGILGLAACAMAGSATAGPLTFAQVSEGGNGFGVSWTNNGAGLGTLNTATPGGDVVSFSFGNIAGLSPALSGPLVALETINGGAGATTTAATLSLGGYDLQAINSAMTIRYALATPIDGQTNLLTITITPDRPGADGMEFVGQDGGSGASSSTSLPIAGGAPYTMTFSSAFLNFVLADPISADFSYSSLDPAMTVDADGLLGDFTAEDTATFSATATASNVNEPASLGVLLTGMIGLCALRKARATVTA
jgi:hypothetical protein